MKGQVSLYFFIALCLYIVTVTYHLHHKDEGMWPLVQQR